MITGAKIGQANRFAKGLAKKPAGAASTATETSATTETTIPSVSPAAIAAKKKKRLPQLRAKSRRMTRSPMPSKAKSQTWKPMQHREKNQRKKRKILIMRLHMMTSKTMKLRRVRSHKRKKRNAK